MTDFITIDANGKLTGIYLDATQDSAPSGAVEVSRDLVLAFSSDEQTQHYDVASGTLVKDTPPPPSKDQLAAYVRQRSLAIELGGAPVNGTTVPTDTRTVAMVCGLRISADDDASATFYFDPGQGDPVQLTSAEAVAFAKAYGAWIQGTFKTRADLLAQVKAGTLKTTADIDAAFTAASS